jgi:small-conductance mechanosensitive channel
MVNLTQIFEQLLQTNASTAEILASILLFAVVGFAGWVIYFVFNRFFLSWAEKTTTTLDDDIINAVKSIIVILIIIIGIEFALTPLSFLQPYYQTLDSVVVVIEVFLGAFGAVSILNIFADYYANRTSGAASGKNKKHVVFMLKKVIQIFVYVCAVILLLFVFRVDLTGAVVGLGIGGIAIAFALQNTLSDFFNAFFIYFDRPFEIGDAINVHEFTGTVTNITIRSTRIKLISGEELIIPNKELTSASVRNFRKLEKRRITFTIGVTYDTPTAKLKIIPLVLRGIIENTEGAEVERVHFTEFGDSALKFLVSYFVTSADYGTYLDIQQTINFAIKEAFDREAIEMAYPTSTVYVRKLAPTNVLTPTANLKVEED